MSRKRKWFLRIVLVLVILFLALIASAIYFPQKFLTVDSGQVKAGVIIVLGGNSHERPQRAAELFKEKEAPRIIVSGAGDDRINRRILLKRGVPADVIQLESRSKTTAENAQFTIKLLRAENITNAIIVTSWYHSRRALNCFRHYAPEIKFYSRPSYFEYKRTEWTRYLMKRVYLEYPKLGGYWICYGVCPL